MGRLIQQLLEGPLDVVGDIHGECEALEKLLEKLGYDRADRHANGRWLVFVGDLSGSGPDGRASSGSCRPWSGPVAPRWSPVITSSICLAQSRSFASGKCRFVARVAWWHEYGERDPRALRALLALMGSGGSFDVQRREAAALRRRPGRSLHGRSPPRVLRRLQRPVPLQAAPPQSPTVLPWAVCLNALAGARARLRRRRAGTAAALRRSCAVNSRRVRACDRG